MVNLFSTYGILSDGLLHLSPRETFELCSKGAVIVDVREDYLNAYKRFDVPLVTYVPLSEIEERFHELPLKEPLIIADAAGLRSKEAAHLLLKLGVKNIANMAGGIVEWERDGLPLLIDPSERMTGGCMCQLRPRDKNKN